MHPIINPWFFYWISVADGIKDFFMILAIVLTASSIVVFIAVMNDDFSKKSYILLLIGCIICWLLFIFIPSKATLTQMLIAKNFTYENIELTKKQGKELIDYIVTITKEEEEKDED